jgi:hypothetical protein
VQRARIPSRPPHPSPRGGEDSETGRVGLVALCAFMRHRVRRGGWRPNYTCFSVFLEAGPRMGRSTRSTAEARSPAFLQSRVVHLESRISRRILVRGALRKTFVHVCMPRTACRLHRGSFAGALGIAASTRSWSSSPPHEADARIPRERKSDRARIDLLGSAGCTLQVYYFSRISRL